MLMPSSMPPPPLCILSSELLALFLPYGVPQDSALLVLGPLLGPTPQIPRLVPGAGWDYCCQPGWCPKPGKGPGWSLWGTLPSFTEKVQTTFHPYILSSLTQDHLPRPPPPVLAHIVTKLSFWLFFPCLFLSYLFTFNIPSPLPSLPILSIKITSSLEGLKCLIFLKPEVRMSYLSLFFPIYYAYLQNYIFVHFWGPSLEA